MKEFFKNLVCEVGGTEVDFFENLVQLRQDAIEKIYRKGAEDMRDAMTAEELGKIDSVRQAEDFLKELDANSETKKTS